MPSRVRSLLVVLPPLLLGAGSAACGHTDVGDLAPASDTAFAPGEPLRLTYSAGPDASPAWSTDPDRILYAFYKSTTSHDLPKGCVGDLPITGGSRGWELCDVDIHRADSSTTAEWPALRSDGAVALVRLRWPNFGHYPYYGDLAVRPPSPTSIPARVLPIPYFIAGRSHQGVAYLQWLDSTHLVWLGQGVVLSTQENVETGYDINILDLNDSLAGLIVVPGTTYASSVARGGNSDTLYYTLGGDSLVYRRTLSTGAVDTVVNFGPLGIARGVQVRQGVLVAVVGGSVTWGSHVTLGMAQHDNGGPLYAVHLPAGVPVLVSQFFDLYQHPALSPDGGSVVAEQSGDLWRLSLP